MAKLTPILEQEQLPSTDSRPNHWRVQKDAAHRIKKLQNFQHFSNYDVLEIIRRVLAKKVDVAQGRSYDKLITISRKFKDLYFYWGT